MKKLLNRKGFTMVELIVVIALMAIMLAILIPMLSTTDARKNEVREYARSFYSNVQELMVDEKLANTELKGDYTLVCAHVNRNKTDYTGVQLYMSYSDSISTLTATTPTWLEDVDDTDDKVELANTHAYKAYEEFATSLRKMLISNERSGVYFAVIDSKYRVVSTYFVEAKTDGEVFDSVFADARSKLFSAECVLGDGGDARYAGAWPEELAQSGKNTFILP
ncbi:MAG: type II secretion system protein [Oscillospiraceae bacterium]|nr:type II secretion system protein [Oscillospiraceae bacterium]